MPVADDDAGSGPPLKAGCWYHDAVTTAQAHSAAASRRPVGRILGPDFFARPSDIVARELIGKIIWREGKGGGRLSEVEAYLPQDDPACHAAKGLTRRNAAMFGPPGTIYVFQSYGVHYLLNLVCEEIGVGSAVLVRSFAPLADGSGGKVGNGGGRGRGGDVGPAEGARGPGVVGRILGVEPSLNGLSLGATSGLFVIDDGFRAPVGVTVRVGISRGRELPLRYYMMQCAHVSRLGRRERGLIR